MQIPGFVLGRVKDVNAEEGSECMRI